MPTKHKQQRRAKIKANNQTALVKRPTPKLPPPRDPVGGDPLARAISAGLTTFFTILFSEQLPPSPRIPPPAEKNITARATIVKVPASKEPTQKV
jgi:hypothetical protein